MEKFMGKSDLRGFAYMVPPRRRFRGRHLFVILLVLGLAVGAYRKYHRPKTGVPQVTPAGEAAGVEPVAAQNKTVAPAPKMEATEKFEIRHQLVHSGDTLEAILKASGIPAAYANDWQDACKSASLAQIKEEDELIFVLSRESGLPVKVIYSRSDGPSYTLRKNSNGWECRSEEAVAGGTVKTIHGSLSDNFSDSCAAAGLPAPLISNLADIFSYDVDFTSDLKDGDSFSVLFQESAIQSSEGKQFLILGAEVNVSGKVYQAFGYQLPDGSWDYYDGKGASLKRAFLKSPINYRLSLAAKTSRGIKPVTRISRPHLAIDYCAPKGTTVDAIGDGVVSSVRKNGKRGFSVEIRHRGGYRSLYGNLSSLGRGVTHGAPVSQEEAIGSIGLGTGGKPCLDFRLYKDGRPVNFLTAEFVRSKVIPKSIVPEFEKSRDFCTTALHGEVPDGQKHEMLSGRD
jgi:murein DD-endopeptidase MepM/ murein hydrolase activator NlpD